MQQHLHEHCYSEGHSGFSRRVFLSPINKTDDFQPYKRKSYCMRTRKTLASLKLLVESAAWRFINTCLMMLFWTRLFLDFELWKRWWIFINFCFCIIVPIIITRSHLETIWSFNNANRLIGFIWTLWSKSIFLTLYIFYLYYYLFVLCYHCFCLFVLIILLLFVVVVAYSSFLFISL